MDAYCFQNDSCELLACVHGGHPVWTLLELAKGATQTAAAKPSTCLLLALSNEFAPECIKRGATTLLENSR